MTHLQLRVVQWAVNAKTSPDGYREHNAFDLDLQAQHESAGGTKHKLVTPYRDFVIERHLRLWVASNTALFSNILQHSELRIRCEYVFNFEGECELGSGA